MNVLRTQQCCVPTVLQLTVHSIENSELMQQVV